MFSNREEKDVKRLTSHVFGSPQDLLPSQYSSTMVRSASCVCGCGRFFFLSKGLLTILTSFGRLEQIPMICGTLRWWAVLLVVRVSAFSFFWPGGRVGVVGFGSLAFFDSVFFSLHSREKKNREKARPNRGRSQRGTTRWVAPLKLKTCDHT
jgi:fatty acid desaturase